MTVSEGMTPSKSELSGDGSNSHPIESKKDIVSVISTETKPFSAYIFACLCCFMVAFGGFIFGWDTGTISGFVKQTDFIARFGQLSPSGEYELSDDRTGLIVSIFNIGCAVGGIFLSKIGDAYGRKIGLATVTAVYVIGIVIQISASDKWYQYFVGRIISGLGVGGIAVLSPMLISETSPKHLRGSLVSCYQLMITAGIFLGYCTNYGTKTNYTDSRQWRIPLGLGFAWALLMIGGMAFVPESPRYLVEAENLPKARMSIARANKVAEDHPIVEHELNTLQTAIELEKLAGKARIVDLFNVKKKIFQRLIIGIFIQSLQQLIGNNYFFYYGTTIFNAVGMDDPFVTSIVLGIVNFGSTFFSLYTVDKFGRRKCLIWGAFAMAICMAIFASVGVTKLWPNGEDQPSSKPAGNVMIVFTCIYIFFFATTWAPIAYVIISEIYPLRVKARAMALATAANWIWGFLIAFFTPRITSAIKFCYGYVFMGCLIFAFFYIFFFVPETKGLTLEDVDEMWQEGVVPWGSESWLPRSDREVAHDA
ncbi:AFL204Cp [Eremothecium gossypii ATCC 10895]|uniref:AFL204Cp n=1 Tax=Eremothecium gossypii (strain ATCC 10895 / CBS 109.51 / FGSC 9923 / NRRL Y-1056) TaxID=284811 RepID=Q755L8_EREGS|nr:AFL204Cp [Eremothecium gossypii ATCC 10895]AAS53170.1 AFL204Cp [Eremothecium gossypii ATCC 10895]